MTSATAFLQSTLMGSDRPIFSRHRVSHTPAHPVTHLAASNLQVVIVMANKSVQRINQANKQPGAAPDIVDFSKLATNGRVSSAFLDPLGSHLLLSLKPTDPEGTPELIYFNKKNQKPRQSTKCRGNLVTSVAWCSDNVSDSLTGPILLATSKGMIFETEFDSGEERMFAGSLEKNWRLAINLGKGQHLPITGLCYHNVEGTKNYFVIATTANRLYQFQGVVHSKDDRPMLLNVLHQDQVSLPAKFLELPGHLKTSSLSFFYRLKERGKSSAKHPLFPTTFAWLTEPGVFHGKVEFDPNNPDSVTADCQLMPFPQEEGKTEVTVPNDLTLTEFHAVMGYDNCIKGVCLLNEQVVFTCDFDPADGKVKGISRDPISGTFYTFTDYVIHKFKVDREERNVWKIFLEKRQFELAQQFCFGDDEKLDEVMTAKANDLFEKGQYVESAMHFAKTKCASFEAIALKFMQIEDKTALLNFLKKRLENVKPSEKTQLTLVVVWLMENYLSKMRKIEKSKEPKEDLQMVQREFETFLRHPKVAQCIDQSKSAIYDLLSEHGDKASILQFAEFTRDLDRLIRHHLQNQEHLAVIKILKEQRKPQLFFQFGPELMQAAPEVFIDAVIEQGRVLMPPTRILPSLVICARKDQELQALRYLEYAVNTLQRREPAIHNFLLSLYVKHTPEKIETYLNIQGLDDADAVPYDIEYTLRLFEESGLKREKFLLYCVLGQLEEAVEVALEIEPELAQRCLDFAEDRDSQRKIWLRIAQFVVQQKKDIRQAMEYLKKSGDLVKIEDILPFFPDFVTIDHFKEAICESLQEYSDHIESLRAEMEESNRSADQIRSEIAEYKNRYIFIKAIDTCSSCQTHLMAKPFHLFSCGHRFHTDCLTQEVIPYLTPSRKRKLDEILHELASLDQKEPDAISVDSGKSPKLSKKDQLRAELDELVASECLYCGDAMIRMVDRPLIDPENYEDALKEWL